MRGSEATRRVLVRGRGLESIVGRLRASQKVLTENDAAARWGLAMGL